MRGDVSTACTCMGSRPWRTRSRRSMRFAGTIMSITLTELSRVKAPGNSRKGCSQRPQAHSRSGPRNPAPSRRGHSPVTIGPKKPGRSPPVERLLRHADLATHVPDGHARRDVLQYRRDLLDRISLLLHGTSSWPARGRLCRRNSLSGWSEKAGAPHDVPSFARTA